MLVTTEDGSGAGAYIGSNQIITNWHVVKGAQTVGVVSKDGKAIPAIVGKVDQERDLALLTVEFVPETVSPLKLGSNAEIQVGTDVHAIGHPLGQTWTYTKGFVSQIRSDYTWEIEGNKHRATVIQHQIPINPGNSGGPLLNDDGTILGINTWIWQGAQGLSFAVSVDDVRALLDSSRQEPSPKIADRLCEEKKVYQGQDAEQELVQFDTNCDGRADVSLIIPLDTSKAVEAHLDTNFDGLTDVFIEDRDRDARWDISFHDTNYDGQIDLIGHHPNGELEPSYWDRYAGG